MEMGLQDTSTLREENPQVRLRPNAKLTPSSRTLLVERVQKLGWPVARAAQAAGENGNNQPGSLTSDDVGTVESRGVVAKKCWAPPHRGAK